MSRQNDLKVFRSPTGLGLKALRDFAVEEEVIEYTGRHISVDEANARPNRYFFQLTDETYIDGSGRDNLARYINHSCAPNAKAFVSHDESKITIEAIEPIKAGDEIVIDYGEDYFESYIAPVGCKCRKCQA